MARVVNQKSLALRIRGPVGHCARRVRLFSIIPNGPQENLLAGATQTVVRTDNLAISGPVVSSLCGFTALRAAA